MKKITILLLHMQHGGIEKQTISFANELSKKYNCKNCYDIWQDHARPINSVCGQMEKIQKYKQRLAHITNPLIIYCFQRIDVNNYLITYKMNYLSIKNYINIAGLFFENSNKYETTVSVYTSAFFWTDCATRSQFKA